MKRAILFGLAAALLCCFSVASGAAEVKKWTDSEGNVHFGDMPPTGQAAEEVRIVEDYRGERSDAERLEAITDGYRETRQKEKRARASERNRANKKWHADLKNTRKIEAAMRENKVIPGMTEDQARKTWGTPTRINTDDYGDGERHQWIYERHGKPTRYVYVKGGMVTAVQNQQQ